MCTRAQGQFAHAATPGAPTIAVAQVKAEPKQHIRASEPPERVHLRWLSVLFTP